MGIFNKNLEKGDAVETFLSEYLEEVFGWKFIGGNICGKIVNKEKIEELFSCKYIPPKTKVYEDDRLCSSCGAPITTVKVKEKQFPEMKPVEIKQEKLVAPISIGNGLNVSGRVDEKTDKWVWDISEDGKEILIGATKQEFDKYMVKRNEILFPYKEMPKKNEEDDTFRCDIPISENKKTIWQILLAKNGRNFGDRETKLKMMEYTNRCFWCNRTVKIYNEDFTYKQIPENCATRDHVFTRLDKRRHLYKKFQIASPCVLSCFKCNSVRGDTIFEKYVEKYASIKNENFIFYFSEKFF